MIITIIITTFLSLFFLLLLLLNYDKCDIGATSMMYIGEVPTGERLRVSGKGVEPIICAPRPPKESEVKSFQGSAQWGPLKLSSHVVQKSPNL